MNKRSYKKKCDALFAKAKHLGLELDFAPELYDCQRLDCIWYGGVLAYIKVSETFGIQLQVEGDVRAYLNDKNGDTIASVKDRNNWGGFSNEMVPFLKSDKQLFAAIKRERLELVENNWIEYDGIIKNNPADGKETFIDLGMICDNLLDNNILMAIEQALDSVEDIKKEIIDVAEIEYKITGVQL